MARSSVRWLSAISGRLRHQKAKKVFEVEAVLATHPVPADRPTNCTFGEADLQTLYVTASGCLYRVRTEHTGYLIYPPMGN